MYKWESRIEIEVPFSKTMNQLPQKEEDLANSILDKVKSIAEKKIQKTTQFPYKIKDFSYFIKYPYFRGTQSDIAFPHTLVLCVEVDFELPFDPDADANEKKLTEELIPMELNITAAMEKEIEQYAKKALIKKTLSKV